MVEKLSDVWELWGLFWASFIENIFESTWELMNCSETIQIARIWHLKSLFNEKYAGKWLQFFVTKEKCVSWPSLNFKLPSLTGASSSQSSANVLHTSQLFLIHSKSKLISLDHFGSLWTKIRNFQKTQIKHGSDSVDVNKGPKFWKSGRKIFLEYNFWE